jgi:transposase
MFSMQDRRVYVFNATVDMRLGFEGLHGLIRNQLGHSVTKGDVYIFLGRNRKRLKALFFDGTGLVLITKRLERGLFARIEEFYGRGEITQADLRLIFAGTRINYPVEVAAA